MKRLIKKAESFEDLKKENIIALQELKMKTDMPMVQNILKDISEQKFYNGEKIENPTSQNCLEVVNNLIQFINNANKQDIDALHMIYDRIYIYAI